MRYPSTFRNFRFRKCSKTWTDPDFIWIFFETFKSERYTREWHRNPVNDHHLRNFGPCQISMMELFGSDFCKNFIVEVLQAPKYPSCVTPARTFVLEHIQYCLNNAWSWLVYHIFRTKTVSVSKITPSKSNSQCTLSRSKVNNGDNRTMCEIINKVNNVIQVSLLLSFNTLFWCFYRRLTSRLDVTS